MVGGYCELLRLVTVCIPAFLYHWFRPFVSYALTDLALKVFFISDGLFMIVVNCFGDLNPSVVLLSFSRGKKTA